MSKKKDSVLISGDECDAENFLRVLNGTASGKLLKSGPEDNVFIYYVDHGAVGLVGMPVGPPLYAKELLGAFEQMHANKQYKEMVVYIEACESGSMLQDLDPTLNIFGTTASMNNESSWATYFDDVIGVYLGDEYSVSWLEDSDSAFATGSLESLETQFEDVEANVNKSSPQQYGDMGMSVEDITNFQTQHHSRDVTPRKFTVPAFLSHMKQLLPKFTATTSNLAANVGRDSIQKNHRARLIEVSDARDVKRNTLLNKLSLAKTASEYVRIKEDLYAEELSRAQFDLIFTHVAAHFTQTAAELYSLLHDHQYHRVNYRCLKEAYAVFEAKCLSWTDYGLKYVKTIVNICDMHEHHQEQEKTFTLKSVIESSC